LPPVLLSASSISKSFDGVSALRRVAFELRAGEVHALVGENGAGKSTLIKIMTGAERPDEGSLAVAGHPVPHMTPALARSLGIAVIYQQASLFPHLTVAENLALALETGSVFRRVNWADRHRRALELLEDAGAAIDPGRLAATLSMPEQQMVEIAKAIGADAKVVIMDEPTASLMDHEVERLFRVIDRLRAQGGGIIYISHRLEELFAVSDRITVLRDGETIVTCDTADIDRPTLIQTMVGRELAKIGTRSPRAAGCRRRRGRRGRRCAPRPAPRTRCARRTPPIPCRRWCARQHEWRRSFQGHPPHSSVQRFASPWAGRNL
jgi:ABC-type sugar transport system ATPase subunit